jgi:hypothetical protein
MIEPGYNTDPFPDPRHCFLDVAANISVRGLDLHISIIFKIVFH